LETFHLFYPASPFYYLPLKSTRKEGSLIRGLLNDDNAFDVLDVVREIAAAHSVPVAQIALAWQMSKPFITAPIIGARTVEQFKEVVGAVDVTLTDEEIARLDAVSEEF
jgi:aryl-alcohol dehydrogenase-like predicted oxidoreductase